MKDRKEVIAAEKLEKERLASLAALEPVLQAAPAEAEKTCEQTSRMLSASESSEDEQSRGNPVMLPSQKAKLAKMKARQKDRKAHKQAAPKAKANAKCTQTPFKPADPASKPKITLAQSKLSPTVSQGVADSVSVASGSTSRGTGKAKSGSRHLAICDLTKVLAGDSLGDKTNNLKRAIDALTKQAATPTEHAELNSLKHHWELAVMCKDHLLSQIHSRSFWHTQSLRPNRQ